MESPLKTIISNHVVNFAVDIWLAKTPKDFKNQAIETVKILPFILVLSYMVKELLKHV